jgi:hypothetical protein
MEFVETPTFTRFVLALMEDDDYAKLQTALAQRPEMGKIISGGGGIRKVRWSGSGRGKRGGLSVVYFWDVANEQIWMLQAYPKNERENLTRDEIKQLKQLVKQLKS